jgi:tripartite motif-containing protein 71
MQINRTWRALIALAVMVAALFGGAIGARAQAPVFLGTLAGPSFASTYAGGVEWDAINSRIIVADTGLDTVEFYDGTTGSFLGSFGGYGIGNGQFDAPRDIAVDSSGNFYVADANNNRIQKFDSSDSWIWSTGGAGKCTTPCGFLNSPLGVTYDAANNQLLVADTGDSLIKSYDPSSGAFIWSSPTSNGFTQPRDATRGPEGLVWVSAYTQNQIKAYAVTSLGSWGTMTPTVTLGDGVKGGKGAGEIVNPYNVAFSPDGKTVYVADIGNDRIARWDVSNLGHVVWLTPFGSRCTVPCPYPADAGRFLFLRRVAVETNGNVIGADLEGNQLNVFTPSGTSVLQIGGRHADPNVGGFAEVYGVAVAPGGAIYAVDRANQRVEKFWSNGAYVISGGYRGVGAARFSWPEAAAVAPDGSVWVADTRNARLEHWPATLSSTSVPSFGIKGRVAGQFNYIEGLTVDASGVIWVADTGNNRIQSCNSSGTCAVLPVTGGGLLSLPQGIAISSTNIYVADTGHNRIVEFTLGGSLVASYTGLGAPQGLALAPDGTLWVADTGNHAIVHLSGDLSNNIGDGFGSQGSGDYQFFAPHSLAVFGNTLYVADTYNNRVQEFDITGA